MKTIQIDSTGRSHEITKEHVAGKKKDKGTRIDLHQNKEQG